MFTGIVTDVGEVRAIEARGDTRLEIGTGFDTAAIGIGTSIACSGVCLTVTAIGPGWFAVAASGETLARTTVGGWRPGTRVNLERALKLGDELGGHLVFGHVDGVGRVADRRPEGESQRLAVELPDRLERLVAAKGSIAVDGVALTVNEVSGRRIAVNVIPHTLGATTLGAIGRGDRVNVEIDMLARYVARVLEAS